MPFFRVNKTKDYTIMANHHLKNRDLSLKAKGLLSVMLSLPEDWHFTVHGLVSICKDGTASAAQYGNWRRPGISCGTVCGIRKVTSTGWNTSSTKRRKSRKTTGQTVAKLQLK